MHDERLPTQRMDGSYWDVYDEMRSIAYEHGVGSFIQKPG